MSNKQVKCLIELSNTVEDADRVIQEYVGLETIEGKLEYVERMFNDVEVIDRRTSDSPELIYNLMLNAIIERKFR